MKLTRERAERPSPPPPLEADDVLVVRVITAGWAVALVILLIVRGSLPAGERWWVWTCVAGLAFGHGGLVPLSASHEFLVVPASITTSSPAPIFRSPARACGREPVGPEPTIDSKASASPPSS